MMSIIRMIIASTDLGCEASDQTYEDATRCRDADNDNADEERIARANDQARQHIAPQWISTQRKCPAATVLPDGWL